LENDISTCTSGPKNVILNSPMLSSSSGNSTTWDCEDFKGGTGGDVTHGLSKLDSIRNKIPFPVR